MTFFKKSVQYKEHKYNTKVNDEEIYYTVY